MNRKVQREQRAQYFRAIFDAIPHPALIVDGELRIQDYNLAAKPLFGANPAMALHRPGGEAIHCIHADLKGCGGANICKDCIIRNSAMKAFSGKGTYRELHKAELRKENSNFSIELLITSSRLPDILPPRVLLVLEDVTTLRTMDKPFHDPRRSPMRD
jgi:PAS domain-containing protein